jgi:hypothetical protein
MKNFPDYRDETIDKIYTALQSVDGLAPSFSKWGTAVAWATYGFTDKDVLRWIDATIINPNVAAWLDEYGFTPDESRHVGQAVYSGEMTVKGGREAARGILAEQSKQLASSL